MISPHNESDYTEFGILQDAACLMVQGDGEVQAIQCARDLEYLRGEAERSGNVLWDENGNVFEYLESELNGPDHQSVDNIHFQKVSERLFEQNGIDVE